MATPLSPMHYADWIRRHAMTRPNAVAIATPRATLTYAGFHRALHLATYRLSELGAERGQSIALFVRNPALHCVIVAALNRMGCISLSLSPLVGTQRQIVLPPNVVVDHLIVEVPCEADVPAHALKVDLDWLKVTKEGNREWAGEGFRDPDAPILIFASSGTTGKPKAITLSTRQWETWLLRYSIGAMEEAQNGKKLSKFGVASAIGFRTMFKSFWAGGGVFIGWPMPEVPRLIAREGIQRIEGAPAQFGGLWDELSRKPADTSTVRALFVAGSATPRKLLQGLRACFRQPVYNDYGSTELGHTSLGLLGPETPLGSCGFLAPWIEAQATDEQGRVLSPGREGILRFRHDHMPTGYFNDPAASETCFRDGWFYPGDLGFVTAERALSVTGRSSERINAGGLKISPDAIEDRVRAFEGVEDCAAFASPDELGMDSIAVAIVSRGDLNLSALRKHCEAALGSASPRKFISVSHIPRTETGKIRRGDLPGLAAVKV